MELFFVEKRHLFRGDSLYCVFFFKKASRYLLDTVVFSRDPSKLRCCSVDQIPSDTTRILAKLFGAQYTSDGGHFSSEFSHCVALVGTLTSWGVARW